MKTFTIKSIVPCYVDFIYQVEAENEEDAVDKFYDSGADFVGKEVGETIGWIDHTGLEITESVAEATPELKEAA